MKKMKITQVKSKIGQTGRQKKTLQALGLRKMHQSIVVEANPQIQGMIEKVRHLLEVEEVK